ncbi:MAG TPA: LuxR family transcriptional regulator [Solimonas sp.]
MTAADLARYLSKYDLVATLDLIDAALQTRTQEQFQRLMGLAGGLVPIENSHASVADLDEHGAIERTRHQININFPTGWLQAYRQQRLITEDPVAKHLFVSDRPLIWGQIRQSNREAADRRFYGRAAEFGLRDGFSFGARFVRSRSASFFSCAGAGLTSDRRHITIIQYMVPHLHSALAKVHTSLLKSQPLLTPREIEVLNWAKFGKTNWDISVQMGISERAVKYHLANAMFKLHAGNRSQAVAVALSQGLIDWG